jgi:alpha-galactosidase
VRKQFAPGTTENRCLVVLRAVLCTSHGFSRGRFLFAGMLGCEFLLLCGVYCVMVGETSSAQERETVVAARFAGRVDAEGFPDDGAWKVAPAIRFDQDWQGKNADPQCQTEVRLLWTQTALYVRFLAHFRSIAVFADAEPSGRRDQLWERDVAEVFLQPSGSDGRRYKEFEVSPNGFWIDLDIAPGEKWDLKSGLKRRARIDEARKIWTAEMVLPMKSLTEHFDPAKAWRVNFFRVEGAGEPRFYSAWQATGTPEPNFHVPEAFGKLVFGK